jgi:hypothetical protein
MAAPPLPTPLVLRTGLLGCVFPQTLRTEHRVVEIFDALAHLLLHDYIASGYVFHDRVIGLGDVVLKGEGLPGEVATTKQNITNGLLNNLPSVIYFSNNMEKYAK